MLSKNTNKGLIEKPSRFRNYKSVGKLSRKFDLASEKKKYDQLYPKIKIIPKIQLLSDQKWRTTIENRAVLSRIQLVEQVKQVQVDYQQLIHNNNSAFELLPESQNKDLHRMRIFEIISDLVKKKGQIKNKIRTKTKNKQQLYRRFRQQLILVSKKIKYFNLAPHQILKYNLFVHQPYVFTDKVFKVVLANQVDELKKILSINRLVIYSYDLMLKTPLMCASTRGYSEIVKILLHYKSDFDHIDNLGNTALHYASKYNHIECLKMLICQGCNLKIKNNNQQNVLEIGGTGLTKQIVQRFLRAASSQLFQRLKTKNRMQYLEQHLLGIEQQYNAKTVQK